MDSDYCRIKIKKRFLKCISVKDGKCYLMIGQNRYIYKIMDQVISNFTKKQDLFQKVSDDSIYLLYDYLFGDEKTSLSKMKTSIKSYLNLEPYRNNIEFIKEDICNDDDTLKDILNKIAIYACSDEDITNTHIYAWYKTKQNVNQSIGFKYNSSIELEEHNLINDRKPVTDDKFVSETGKKIMVPMENTLLELFETCDDISNDTIYFCSLKQFLKAKDYEKDDLFSVLQEDSISRSMKLELIHGIITKYWPYVESSEIIDYDDLEESRKNKHDEKKKRYIESFKYMNLIESEYFLNEPKLVKCSENTIEMMQLLKSGDGKNIVNLTNIFRDVRLSEKIPFMKLILESRDDVLFKVNNKHMIYDGKDKTETRFISKDVCKLWSDDLVLQTNFGYRYLHKENAIIMKVYDSKSERYTTLVIHLNGDIECVFSETGPQTTEPMILNLIKLCNEVIKELNQQTMYSFDPLLLIDEDIYENQFSETKLNFKNCRLTFPKTEFEDKQKKILPNVLEMIETFIANYPLYFRVKLLGEVDDDTQKIVCSYKRVNNYAAMETIESFISTITHMKKDIEQDEIIEELRYQFSLSHEEAYSKYISWKETTQMKLQSITDNQSSRRERLIVKESGAEVIISYQENLQITMKQITSFNEYKRILMFIKTMVFLYQQTIKEEVADEMINKLFAGKFVEELDDEELDDEELDDEELDDEELEELDLDDDSDDEDAGDLSDLSDLEEDSDEEPDDEIDYDQLGGANKVYETQSYYLKRLKKRDKKLFHFKSKKNKPNGTQYGYTSFCQATDKRVPVVISREELERINQSESDGSGRESYSNAITVDGRSPDLFYICPKYWDISKELSIRPDYVDSLTDEEKEKILIPEKLPKGTRGKTIKYILQRTGDNWSGATKIDYYKTMITDESRLLHPEGYGLPCCFNMSKLIKKGADVRSDIKKSESNTYISKADPSEFNKYAHIHPQLKMIFKQEREDLLKKTSKGFLKRGVNQNKILYNYEISSFLESYCVLSGFKGTTNDFIDTIQEALESNLQLFQKCPFFIHSQFRKTSDHNYEYISEILQKKETKKLFQKTIINKLLIQIRRNEFDFEKNESVYLLTLISTLENYCNYLRSDENRNHEFILPVLSIINDKLNIVLFENIDDQIIMKETDYNSSTQFAFMYKRNDFYEPILYRYYEKSRIKELNNFNSRTLQNNHLEKIVSKIQSYILSNYKSHPLDSYKKIIEDTKDKIQSYYLNHYSQVSYIYTEKQNIIPVPPCEIPNDNIPFIYDFVSYSDVKPGDKVQFRMKQEMVDAKVLSLLGNNKVEIEDKNKKRYSLLFTRLCFIKQKNECSAKRPDFSKVMSYIKDFQSLIQIKGICVNDDNYIVSIILNNETYIPIVERLYEKHRDKMNTLPLVGNHDLLLLENKLREIDSKHIDKCQEYQSYHSYEEFIMKLSHHHLIYLITHYQYDVPCIVTDEKTYKVDDRIRFEYTKNLRSDETIFEIKKTIMEDSSISGVVKELKGKQIIVSISLYDYLSTIIDDPIQIIQDKKKDIYKCIQRNYVSDVFYVVSDSDFEFLQYRQTHLCLGSQHETYPCYKQGDESKLIIKENDYEKKPLLEKIIFRFIDLLMIHGIENMSSIIHETISVQFLKHMKISNEDIYSYDELRSQYLDTLFQRRNPFIQHYQSSHSQIRKINVRLLNENPYIIRKLYGQGVTITFMNEIKNKDFQLLALALSEVVSESINEHMLKELLIQHIENTQRIIELFKNGKQKMYTTIEEIIDDINSDTYIIDEIDIRIIIEELNTKGNDVACILFSQKYNPKRTYKHYVLGDINDTTKIISCCHSFNTDKNRYDLSSILKGNKYSFTRKELIEINSFFQRFLS